jgi:peptidoglycan/xylan/chitin deacetylase (PgdA/CDA1 family)
VAPRVAAEEMRHSKQLLEDALGSVVSSFAYPYGFQSATVRRLVRAAGYTSACAVMNALSSSTDNPFALARLTVRADSKLARLRDWIAGADARVAPYPERVRTRAWRVYRAARGGRRLIRSSSSRVGRP